MTEMLLYLYAESPVHAGAADSLGVLDLPVQREATTRYPVIWGQSLKGALRQAALEDEDLKSLVVQVFGAPVGRPDDNAETEVELSAGLLTVGDAQVVAMPVPTLQRTFAWVTSELALHRLARKYARLDVTGLPQPPRLAPEAGAAASGAWTGDGGRARSEVLGPCLVELGTAAHPQLRQWAAQLAADVLGDADPVARAPLAPLGDKLREDLLAVGSDVMPMLLTECTEFVARVKLKKDKKTVEHGPFHSEYLPAETILAASLTLRSGDEAMTEYAVHCLRELLHDKLIQVGGDETIGKGLVWARLLRADNVRAVADPETTDGAAGVGR